jgi:hypothetical protein
VVTAERKLSDEQWLVLDLLMRARKRGVDRINRIELLNSSLPQQAKLKLTFAALTMPNDLVVWQGQHDFAVTEDGVALFNLRFGKGNDTAVPTAIADHVICLPGPEHYLS